jgi:hypothetical protein
MDHFVVINKADKTTAESASTLLIDQPVVLVDPRWGFNFGHAYVDYIFSAYAGASQLGLNISEFAFLETKRNNFEYRDKFATFLTLIRSTLSRNLLDYGTESLCFSKLLLPGYHGYFYQGGDIARYSQGLRDTVYHYHLDNLELKSSPQKIIMAFKKSKTAIHGGRILLNVDEVRRDLTRRYKNFEMYDFGELSLYKQVSLMRSAAMFISPFGGASAVACLLPDNATFLHINSFNFVTNQSQPSAPWEYEFFHQMEHITLQAYDVTAEEVVNTEVRPDRVQFSYGSRSLLFANYQLNTKTLIQSIDAALNATP